MPLLVRVSPLPALTHSCPHLSPPTYSYSHVRGDGHGGRLQFVGHDVTDVDDLGGLGGTLAGMRADGDSRRPIPRRVPGTLHARTNAQVFCSTPTPLTDGMCGGPVLWRATAQRGTGADTEAGADTDAGAGAGAEAGAEVGEDVIVGMVEGIVPLEYQDKAMRGVRVCLCVSVCMCVCVCVCVCVFLLFPILSIHSHSLSLSLSLSLTPLTPITTAGRVRGVAAHPPLCAELRAGTCRVGRAAAHWRPGGGAGGGGAAHGGVPVPSCLIAVCVCLL